MTVIRQNDQNMTSIRNNQPDEVSGELQRAILLTQIGVDLREQSAAADKHVGRLRTALSVADRSVAALRGVARNALEQARRSVLSELSASAAETAEGGGRQECDRLMAVIDGQLSDLEFKHKEISFPDELHEINEKIQQLENIRQQNNKAGCENNNTVTPNASNRNIKTDERYPENLSRESLIDLDALQNLPPVPEDIFTSFSSRPSRSSSLSSLKSMRKIKMYLQKAESSDDDDSSDAEDHDYSKLICGDVSEEQKMLLPHSPTNKKVLGNIKEEVHDQ